MSPARIFGALLIPFLFLSLLVFNFFQTLSLLIRPVSLTGFRRFNRECANLWWGIAALSAERLYGTRPIFTGDKIPIGENAIVIANHQEMPDILAIMTLAIRKRRLGDMKWFVKNIIRYVPGVGWGMLFLDCVFLKRNWNRDARSIRKVFQKLIDSPLPFWLIFFPEGTRIKPRKLASATLHARRKKLWTPEHVLIPRTKGFCASVQNLRCRADAVYDLTIGYENKVPSLWDLFSGRIRAFHMDVRRFPIAELPEDEEGLSGWLLARYERKNRFLADFKKRGAFDAPRVSQGPVRLW